MAICELDDEQAYETELSQCVGVTGYQHWFFQKALADAKHYEFRAFAVDSGGERLGLVPLQFRRFGPVTTANFSAVPAGPVLRGEALRAGRMTELLRELRPVLRRHLTVAAHWDLQPDLNVKPEDLTGAGRRVGTWENFVVPATKSADDCWKAMSTGRRQSIRQTEGRGVVVRDSTPEEITQWFPEQMINLHAKYEGPPAYSEAVVRSMTQQLASHPRMLWRTAHGEDGTLYGMTASIVGEDRLWGWQMVGPPVRSMSPHTLLHWDSIKWAGARGLAYDMGSVPNEGIGVIKRSLGGEAEAVVGVFEVHPAVAYKALARLHKWLEAAGNSRRARRVTGS
jgi:CelD/BcsL family acetyltransferase involved in cellulose biosynthesis